jgi:hypothetical protein
MLGRIDSFNGFVEDTSTGQTTPYSIDSFKGSEQHELSDVAKAFQEVPLTTPEMFSNMIPMVS